MNNTFKKLFGPITAEEALKNRTKAFLAERTRGYSRAGAKRRRHSIYAAACACLLFILLGGHWLYFTPTAEISIDINPSLELSINRFDQVIAIRGFNEEGRELSHTLHIKYKNYVEAIHRILLNDTVSALLSGDEIMTITVSGPDEQQSFKILSGVEACTAEHANACCYFARSEEVAAAHESGLSCGKYRAFLELQLLDPDATPEAVRGMTMREIRDRIDRLSSDGGSDSPPSGGCGNGHHGNGSGHGGWRHGWGRQDLDE